MAYTERPRHAVRGPLEWFGVPLFDAKCYKRDVLYIRYVCIIFNILLRSVGQDALKYSDNLQSSYTLPI